MAFNLIKNNIYNKIFKTIRELRNDIDQLREDPKINNDIIKVYIKTLKEYFQYSADNKDKYNLNEFKNEFCKRKRKRNKD